MSNIYIKPRVMGLVLALLLLVEPLACATSLWSDSSNMYADRKARAVGDVLTIIISESSSATRSGSANNSKSSEVNLSAGTGLFTFVNPVTGGSSDSFKADGKITNTNSVSGRITVQVTAIKPNGNLVIAGTQNIRQNGEEQKINISGEVRPDDVTADNTVLSSYVANAQLRIDGKGPIAGKQRQGILSQIFNFLF